MALLPRGLAARLSAWRVRPGALVWQPPPPAGGDPARARRLARGVLLLDGRLVETDAGQPWDLTPPDRAWSDALHGHGWLDDAAAADDPALWPRFEAWVWAWIDRYGDGTGPGWRADLVARRLSRWIAYSIRLLRGRPPERSRAFFRAMAGHARYLGWRWREIEGGPRIEALGGLVYATLSMEGPAHAPGKPAARAVRLLGREAARVVGPDGGIASRNPDELARVLSVLAWSAEAIEQAGKEPADGHVAAMRRAAPIVRALTMPGGALARFHGGRGHVGLGGAGLALPDTAGWHPAPAGGPGADGRVMGYLRMAAGAAVLALDAAPPPAGRHAATAHLSALGFELWLGGLPVIVSCGSGLGFGERDAVAARHAAAHSTVELAGRSPGHVRPGGRTGGPPWLLATGDVRIRTDHAGRIGQAGHAGHSPDEIGGGEFGAARNEDGRGEAVRALAESTLYAGDLGLVIERRLELSSDGRRLAAQDTVLAPDAGARARVARLFPEDGPPCPVVARFHLHPDVRAEMALAGRAVSLVLPDGGRWLMRAEADMALRPSRYYDEGRAQPRATMQIVATTAVMQYWARIDWTLERVGGAARPRAPGAAN